MRAAMRLLPVKIDITMISLCYQARQAEEAPDGYPGCNGRQPGNGYPGCNGRRPGTAWRAGDRAGGPVLARPAHAGAGHRPAAGRGGACRAGRSPESRRRRGADSALRPGLYRQRPRTARAHRRRARAGARRPAVRPLPRHHPRAWPAVGEPVHQPHRGLHPDPQPGISAGQGQRAHSRGCRRHGPPGPRRPAARDRHKTARRPS